MQKSRTPKGCGFFDGDLKAGLRERFNGLYSQGL
jgi:hypothetical protein